MNVCMEVRWEGVSVHNTVPEKTGCAEYQQAGARAWVSVFSCQFVFFFLLSIHSVDPVQHLSRVHLERWRENISKYCLLRSVYDVRLHDRATGVLQEVIESICF